MESFVMFCLAVILPLFLIIYFSTTKRKLPHGPAGFPILGNLPQFLNNPHLKGSKWAQRYGKMYTMHFGTQPVLIVNDVKTIKEIFGTIESTGMFKSDLVECLYEGPWGIINSEGHQWVEQRRFCIKAMKEEGFGNANLLDPVIMNEVDELCSLLDSKIESHDAENVHVIKMFMRATSNTIWNIITGEELKTGDSQVFQILEGWVTTLNKAAMCGVAFLPWLKYIIPDTCGYTDYYNVCQQIRHLAQAYFKKKMEARKAQRQVSNSCNLIGAYLDELERCNDSTSSFYGESGMQHGLCSVIALLLGGSETTASTLTWLIFYMVSNPHVQEKLQMEMDTVIGKDRDPTITDRARMPYTEAVILETLRYSSLAPFGVPHRLISDITYESFVLPKGMFLIANIYHANHNAEVWTNPENFQPERFLENDSSIKKHLKESVASFQEGRRKCPGEQLARDTLFLFTTKLFQKYSFYPTKNVIAEEYLKPKTGMMLAPPSLGVTVIHRF